MCEGSEIIFKGASFTTMEGAVLEWTVQRGKSYKVFCGNKTRTGHRCKSEDSCPSRVYVTAESRAGNLYAGALKLVYVRFII